jgi:hypothetical protein
MNTANQSEPHQFDPEMLHGISFYDEATRSQMRYIYPDARHWCAGWIVRKTFKVEQVSQVDRLAAFGFQCARRWY